MISRDKNINEWTTTDEQWQRRHSGGGSLIPHSGSYLVDLGPTSRIPDPTLRTLPHRPRTLPRGPYPSDAVSITSIPMTPFPVTSFHVTPPPPWRHPAWTPSPWRHSPSIRRDGSAKYRFVYPRVRTGLVYLLTVIFLFIGRRILLSFFSYSCLQMLLKITFILRGPDRNHPVSFHEI